MKNTASSRTATALTSPAVSGASSVFCLYPTVLLVLDDGPLTFFDLLKDVKEESMSSKGVKCGDSLDGELDAEPSTSNVIDVSSAFSFVFKVHSPLPTRSMFVVCAAKSSIR